MNNKILMVLLLLIHGSLSGRIQLTDPSDTTEASVSAIRLTEAQLFFETVPSHGELGQRVLFM